MERAGSASVNMCFQNVGDGTYLHSGLLAIRAAVASDTTITFKLLYNDAVAMTGGQPFDGPLTVSQVTQQLLAESVNTVTVVTDDVDGCRSRNKMPAGVKVVDRQELDLIQRNLREISGVTAIVYDQTCAAEKRRRRKRENILIRPNEFLSILRSAKVAVIAEFSPTALQLCRMKRI